MNSQPQKGFTLIELMVALAVAAIVLTAGAPSFRQMIEANRLTTVTNEFITTLNLARSEAIKRGTRATVCKSANGTSCDTSSTGWNQGWIVFVDTNNDAGVDTGETILLVHGAPQSGYSLTGNANVNNYISFVATGQSQLINGVLPMGTVTVCKAPNARAIVLNGVGRVRVDTTTCT